MYIFISPWKVSYTMLFLFFLLPADNAKCNVFNNQDMNSTGSPIIKKRKWRERERERGREGGKRRRKEREKEEEE